MPRPSAWSTATSRSRSRSHPARERVAASDERRRCRPEGRGAEHRPPSRAIAPGPRRGRACRWTSSGSRRRRARRWRAAPCRATELADRVVEVVGVDRSPQATATTPATTSSPRSASARPNTSASLDLRKRLERDLDLARGDVESRRLDHLGGPPREEQVAVAEVAAIAGVVPAVGVEDVLPLVLVDARPSRCSRERRPRPPGRRAGCRSVSGSAMRCSTYGHPRPEGAAKLLGQHRCHLLGRLPQRVRAGGLGHAQRVVDRAGGRHRAHPAGAGRHVAKSRPAYVGSSTRRRPYVRPGHQPAGALPLDEVERHLGVEAFLAHEVEPACRAGRSVQVSPPTQKNGIAAKIVSSRPRWRSPARFAPWRTCVPWVCTTPLGSLVVPDV